ncbi:MAG: hypothetical protein BroJett038_12420 [Chloroflexota bacterium]|nr:MAG: hypothetical protein BroJett038_12420 [Chloroflexota bacterium]
MRSKPATWIKERRIDLKMSQEDLAARLQLEGFQVTAGAISHWENGRHDPPLENPEFRIAIGKALRLNPTALLRRAGYEVANELSDNARQAAEIVDQLSEEQQRLALGILEQILRAGAGR